MESLETGLMRTWWMLRMQVYVLIVLKVVFGSFSYFHVELECGR